MITRNLKKVIRLRRKILKCFLVEKTHNKKVLTDLFRETYYILTQILMSSLTKKELEEVLEKDNNVSIKADKINMNFLKRLDKETRRMNSFLSRKN